MKKWVWHIGLAAASALSALFVACSFETAGSSFETENSVALTVKYADGSRAARTKVVVRPQGYLAGSNSYEIGSDVVADSAAGIFDRETDDQGQLNLPKMAAGDYVVEARGETQKATSRISVRDSVCDTLSLNLANTGSLSGQVVLPAGVSSARVAIRGLDYFVQTDSVGNFVFESLPSGKFDAVSFVYEEYTTIDVSGKLQQTYGYQYVGTSSDVAIASDKALDNVIIGRLVPQDTVPKDTVPADTTTKDTVAVDTTPVYPHVVLDDFEDSTFGWYRSYSNFASVKLTTDKAGEGREGLAAHMECHTDSLYNVWTMIGHNFADFTDFSDLDSVVLWARGINEAEDSMWVSISFDVHADSTSGYEAGKAWRQFRINEEWKRIVLVPDSLIPADSNRIGGNIGWDKVKDHVNSFGIFGGKRGTGDFDIWIDDVEIYGVKALVP